MKLVRLIVEALVEYRLDEQNTIGELLHELRKEKNGQQDQDGEAAGTEEEVLAYRIISEPRRGLL